MTAPDHGGARGGASPGTVRRVGGRRRRVRRTIAILALVAGVGAVGGAGAWWLARPRLYRPGEAMPEITRRLARDLPEGAPDLRFTDVTAASGLGNFRSFAGERTSQLPEDMGGGAAWGDFDGDGDDDLFLVSNGGPLDAPPEDRAPSVLYENRGDGTFRVADAFPDLRIIGMAAAWGDADGDGRLDLVVTGYDTLLLFRNEDGRFVRDTRFPALGGYWAGVAWGDFDGDRDPDLYVCGYVRYVRNDKHRALASRQFGTVVPYTLNPSSYEPERNLLLRNDGTGVFEDVAESLGVANVEGRSLGALWHDFDQDGRLDLYVANDVSDNVFFRNTGDGFEDLSHAAWVADYRGAMGLAVGDHDRDGDDDLFISHWIAQENALYDSLLVDLARGAGETADSTQGPVEVGGAEGKVEGEVGGAEGAGGVGGVRFVDVGSAKGLGQVALQMIGWGTEFADFDADGWIDLAVANGSTFETAEEPKRLRPQRSFLFWNRRGEAFHDLAPYVSAMSVPHVSRGLAVADYDEDGDQDLLIVHRDGGVQLLRNDTEGGHAIQLRLRSRGRGAWGGRVGRDESAAGFGDGAVVTAEVGGVTIRRAVGGGSYLSQSSRTLHLGLGAADRVTRLEVRWIGGGRDVYENLSADALWELREGDAEPRLVRSGAAGPGPGTGTGGGAGAGERAAAVTADGGRAAERARVVLFWEKHRAAMQAMKVDGDLETAIGLFREALELDPAHEDARYYLGHCLAVVGETEAARRELEELVRINPRSHRALKGLGILRAVEARSRDDLREAAALLERALDVNLEETGAPMALSEVELMLGESAAAERRLEWVCRTNPRAVSAFFLRGYIAWKRGDEEAARALLAQAAAARGDDWKPEGATAEGDVGRRMHADRTPLSRFWRAWNGTPEPQEAFGALGEYLGGEGRRD